jgi:hypothetical protein
MHGRLVKLAESTRAVSLLLQDVGIGGGVTGEDMIVGNDTVDNG